ncbi:MAG: aminotransferase class I/II-fold pyridoxal phosphate-dependent enzyme, partial [Thermaurantiacus tibetensis]
MTGTPAPKANPWIEAIAPYTPGEAKLRGVGEPLKLSANENPWGPSPVAVAAVRAHAHGVHRYPDGAATRLRERIGFVHRLDPARIVVGTGSDEILQLLPLIYCRAGDSVVHVRHGFMVYPIAARRAGAEPLAARGHFVHELVHVWQHQQGIRLPWRRLPFARYRYLPLA